ncbi:hypothetical protein MTR67_016976 [Solanum verrucosum]|uniref:Gag-pol polyprotein n=1 Tax=Solanum verrucosum TaxID=315347 RepID=A0AAF0QMX8_SOLVR|nr:hypothetical protein MTR67_016976 [Solanum verrucosum]
MGVSPIESANLAAYQFNGVAKVWYKQWKEDRGVNAGPVDWNKFVTTFLDRFLSLELREAKVELLVELTKERDQETQIDKSKDADLEELHVNEPYTIAKGRDKRQIRKSERLIEQEYLTAHVFVAAEEEIKDLDPSSYVEAASCKDAAQWQLAMMEEI